MYAGWDLILSEGNWEKSISQESQDSRETVVPSEKLVGRQGSILLFISVTLSISQVDRIIFNIIQYRGQMMKERDQIGTRRIK